MSLTKTQNQNSSKTLSFLLVIYFSVIFLTALSFLLCAGSAFAGKALPGPPNSPRTRVIFIGDIMAHAQQLERPRASGWDFSPQFRRVKPLFGDALVVGNLETVFAGGENYTGYPTFNTPDGLALALTDLGVNAVTLANNHILDKGSAGASRTIETLNGSGILWTGLGSGDVLPNSALTVEHGGARWAFVNFSYGSNRVLASSDVHLNLISNEAVLAGLRDARLSSPDITVACFHWGSEYQYSPTKRQKETAQLCLDNGVNLVVGTHPHVLQPIEVTEKGQRVIAYSLGNFISFQRTKPRERSAILAVDFQKGESGFLVSRVSVAPIWVNVSAPDGKKGRLVEAVYAGTSSRFNHAGLSTATLKNARAAGQAVLDFLGAAGEPDSEGFYTLWDAASPDIFPKSKNKSPM